jgi:transaldolase
MALSAKAGATYTSIFSGRVADEGGDPWDLVSKSVEWLRSWGYKTKIVVGSIRGVIDLQNAAVAGAHIITIPPQFLAKWVDHKYSRDTVKQFMDDARKAFKSFKK